MATACYVLFAVCYVLPVAAGRRGLRDRQRQQQQQQGMSSLARFRDGKHGRLRVRSTQEDANREASSCAPVAVVKGKVWVGTLEMRGRDAGQDLLLAKRWRRWSVESGEI